MRTFRSHLTCMLLTALSLGSHATVSIQRFENRVELHAGMLQRSIELTGANVSTTYIAIQDVGLLATAAAEITFRLDRASPNQCPTGISAEDGNFLTQNATATDGTDTLDIEQHDDEASGTSVEWQQIGNFSGNNWTGTFKLLNLQISEPQPGKHQLILRARVMDDPDLQGLSVSLFYEVYDGYPVIRKWAEFRNNSQTWLRVSELTVDDVQLDESFLNRTPLTPSERGAVSSIVGFGNADQSKGVILASEIPSALRAMHDQGAMGYNDEIFEWILGPGEAFISEPVFMFAYAGEIMQTVSAQSTPLDRAVERPFQAFLKHHMGVAADDVERAVLTGLCIGPKAFDESVAFLKHHDYLRDAFDQTWSKSHIL